MRGRLTPLSAILLTLAAIGLVTMLIRAPGKFIIPAVVFGIVFLLYKFPPGRRARNYRAPRPFARDRRKTGAAPRRKSAPFKVIEGGRNDDEDRPGYH
jgi:hypothetical protein